MYVCMYVYVSVVHGDGSLGRGIQWQRHRRGGPGSPYGAAAEMSGCQTIRD